MTVPGRKATLVEVAAWVCKALAKEGIEPVLVGGAAVSAHTANRYLSLDVDLATQAPEDRIAKVMESIGFTKTGRVWSHPQLAPTVDFVPGPPAAGRSNFSKFMTLKTRYGPVTVTTPTQSVMDRLAAFYHWNDHQSLKQALLIARRRKIDLRAVHTWSDGEGMTVKYEVFRRRLARLKSPKRN